MDSLDEHERNRREFLRLEYETLHRENWGRGQGVWLVNSILITGSLIVAFTSLADRFLASAVSLFLVVMSFMINATADRVTQITYDRMEGIRKLIGMTGPTEMYQTKIEGRWWYSIRRNLPYVLYLVMASTYLLMLIENTFVAWMVLIGGFLAILVREFLSLVKRWVRARPQTR